MTDSAPLITVVIPSFNQGLFLERAILSVLAQDIDKEIVVIDGGSTDNSVDIIKRYQSYITYWHSRPDNGQADAINQGISKGTAPFVCWLNSDDAFLNGGLVRMYQALRNNTSVPVLYAKCWHIDENDKKIAPYLSFPFSRSLLANYCFIGQPATLIRRSCWEKVNGLDESFHYAMDYDLWLRLYNLFGDFIYLREYCSANRLHNQTKTHNGIDLHYKESIRAVKQAFNYVPLKWYVALPIMRIVRKLAALRYS